MRPHIEELDDIELRENRTATLLCLSKGDPHPEMTFHKLGRNETHRLGDDVIIRRVAYMINTDTIAGRVVRILDFRSTGRRFEPGYFKDMLCYVMG